MISNGVEAVCETICNFTYSFSYTPVITLVSPTNTSTVNIFNITGTNFGTDLNGIYAKIGSQNCIPISLSQIDTNITQLFTCQLDGLNLGNQDIQLNIQGETDF